MIMKKLIFASLLIYSVLAQAKDATRIALLSDPHVSLKTSGAVTNYGPHFEQAIAAVNAAKVDVVLVAGDLGNEGKSDEWQQFKNYIKKFDAPVFYVPGNHDVGNKLNSGKTNNPMSVERVATYEKEMGKSFYAVKKAGVRIIGVNASLLGSNFEREREQWEFLEKQLSKPSKEPTILFMHYPLFQKSADEGGGTYFDVEPEPRKRLIALLHQGGVKTVLTGHLHENLVNRLDGILYVSTEPISFGMPRGKQPEGWTLVTVAENGEATFEVKNLEQP